MSDKELFNILLKNQEKAADEIAKINVTLVAQHHTLKEHMRRSLANEEAIEVLKDELKPIQTHVTQVSGVLKFFGIISLVFGFVITAVKVKDIFF